MKSIKILSFAVLWWSLPAAFCWSVSSYSNSSSARTSSTSSSTITAAPVYCGTCALYFEVHAHIWYSSVYTAYVASMVYTIDSGTGSTIGSSVKYTPNATAMIDTNFTAFADWGAVEYTTLNTLADADQRATLVQINSVSMNGTKNGYGLSTQWINTAETGTARTQCNGSFYGYYGGTATNIGLPEFTDYSYTTVFPFGVSSGNVAAALTYGLDTLASEVATYLHLTVPNCTSYGGGSGTLKVGVTALTSVSMTYVTAAQITSNPPPASNPPPPDTTPAQASPSPAPPAPPSPTAPAPTSKESTVPPEQPYSNPAQGVSPVTQIAAPTPNNPSQPESSSEVAIAPQPSNSAKKPSPSNLGEVTTILQTISGASGPQTISQVVTLGLSNFEPVTTLVQIISGPSGLQTISAVATLGGAGSGSYITTLVQTTSGPTGAETLSEVATIPIGSFILSIMGIGTETAVKSSLGLGAGSGSYTTTLFHTISGPLGLQTVSEVATLASGSYVSNVGGVGGPIETGTSTLGPGVEPGPGSGSTPTSPVPATFTGLAARKDRSILPWAFFLGLAVVLLE